MKESLHSAEFIELRDIPFSQLLAEQEKAFLKIKESGGAVAICAEVKPTITLGRRFHSDPQGAGVWASPEILAKQEIEVLPVQRGGKATYHGPGQWILFLVTRLEDLTGSSRGVRSAVDFYLQLAKRVAAKYTGVEFEIRQDAELGLWSGVGKLASVGIEVREGVLLHGMSINVYRTAQSFSGLNPCGLDAIVDFLENHHFASEVKKGAGEKGTVMQSVLEILKHELIGEET